MRLKFMLAVNILLLISAIVSSYHSIQKGDTHLTLLIWIWTHCFSYSSYEIDKEMSKLLDIVGKHIEQFKNALRIQYSFVI